MNRRSSLGLALHVIESGGLYGIERMLLSLLPALRRQGWQVGLACMGEAGSVRGQVGAAAARIDVPVWYVGYSGRASTKGLVRLNQMVSASEATVVHLHGYKATILAGTLCLARRLPAVATYHCEASKAAAVPRLRTYLAIETRVLRRLDRVIAVSPTVRDELLERRVPVRRVCVIPNGISATPAGSEEQHVACVPPWAGPTLLTVGRLVPEKNVSAALKVLATVRACHPDTRLLVAGDGPLRSALEVEAHHLGVWEAVHFLGFVDSSRALFSHCDCFLLPSDTEGLPIALLEAMAAAVPIVATSVGGIPSAIADGIHGILTPPGDIDSLWRAVARILDDRSVGSSLGASARQRFERDFTDNRMARAYADEYANTMASFK